jgi:hypothetical protein
MVVGVAGFLPLILFFFFFLMVLGFELARQALYHLSHVSGPFALVILEIGSPFIPQG